MSDTVLTQYGTGERHHRGPRTAASPHARGRRGTRNSATIAINLAPMIDVTFLLLIFFLVTTTFERAEGLLSSEMPGEGGAAAVALPLSPIVVRVSQVGTGFDDIIIRIDKLAKAPSDVDGPVRYLRELQELPGFDKETPVVIVAGNDVRWDHVVNVWNAALRAGCTRIAFGEP